MYVCMHAYKLSMLIHHVRTVCIQSTHVRNLHINKLRLCQHYCTFHGRHRMKKTSVVALVLLVLAASHFRASSANEEIAGKPCVGVYAGMFT